MNIHRIARGWTPALFCLCGIVSPWTWGGEITGYVGAEARLFQHDPLFAEQSDNNASLSAYLEYYHDFDDGNQRVAFTGFGRVDSEDDERTHADIRELYWWKNFDSFELYVGVRKLFWGVTESIHLVDVLNQTDTLENIDGEDKLGQPMVEFVTVQDWGTFSAYILPYFREREVPGPEGRLRFGLPVLDDAVYESGAEEQHVDVALRWSHYIGIWDFGVSHFSGTSRSPVYTPQVLDDGSFALQANYSQVEQSGVDIQATIDAWLFKLESISVKQNNVGRKTAAAGGIEYSIFAIGGTDADLGIVAEYQFDDRTSIAQNDLVLGARWAFNDLDGSEILVLATQDLDYDNRFFSVELSRRFSDDWKVEAEARVFSSIDPETPEFQFRNDDYIQIELRRYF